MSLVALESPVPFPFDRKRTSSFSYPKFAPPLKVPRVDMGQPLRRTESFISLDVLQTNPDGTSSVVVPYTRSLQYYKDQRELRKKIVSIRQLTQPNPKPKRRAPPPTLPLPPLPIQITRNIRTPPSPPPSASPSPRTHPHRCPTSPLSPTPFSPPPRPAFPRSKPEPDLRRKALKTCMRRSPEGLKILRMGPHLAVSMISATRDLERIVMAAEGTDVEDREGETKEELHMQGLQIQEVDVVMQDATPAPLTKSWVVLPPPSPTSEPDWEMVEK